jgi:hypothetical protein
LCSRARCRSGRSTRRRTVAQIPGLGSLPASLDKGALLEQAKQLGDLQKQVGSLKGMIK